MIHKNNRAFTMLELTMVIVVLGILASLAIPRMDRDIRQEAGDNILSAIRYTQHMALTDNVINTSNAEWQQAFWRFGFEKCSDSGMFYYVAADKDMGGNIDASEAAIDPKNGLRIMGSNAQPCESNIEEQTNASPDIFITKNHNISDGGITFTNCGNGDGKYIGFDQMGRPHRGFVGSSEPNYATIITTDCVISLDFDDASFDDMEINISKETGYAFIVGQEDS